MLTKANTVCTPRKESLDVPWAWDRGNSSIVSLRPPREGRLLFISDVHFDTHREREFEILLRVVSDQKPSILILGGDIWDIESVSRFRKSPARALHHLQQEFDTGRPYIEELCKHSRRVILQCGNHEDRIYKFLSENPGLWGLKALDLKTVTGLPRKVEVLPYLRLLSLGSLHTYHGDIANKHTAQATFDKLHVSCIVGHVHRPEIRSFTRAGRTYVVAVSGTFQDPRKVEYTNFPDWTCGYVEVNFFQDKGRNSAFAAELRLFQNGALYVPGFGTYK